MSRLQDLKVKKQSQDTPMEFTPLAEGDYIAKIAGIGIKYDVEREFSGETKIQNEITFLIAVNETVLFSRPMKFSAHEKSTLFRTLKLILKNNSLTQDEVEDEMQEPENYLTSLINREVAIDVVHNTYKEKTYANLDIIKLRSGDVSDTPDDYAVNQKLANIFEDYLGAIEGVEPEVAPVDDEMNDFE